MWVFGGLFAVLTAARQALPGELSSPALAFAAIVAWLWWLPNYLRAGSTSATRAILAGLVATVAGQSALHGLDVHILTGLQGALAGVVLGAAFGAALWWVASTRPVITPGGAWGAAILGPYLFLQLTLLTNLGRLQVTSGWDILPVSVVVLLALLSGLAILTVTLDRRVYQLLGVLAVVLLVPGEWMTGWAVLALIPIQVGLAAGLSAAFAGRGARVNLGFVAGALAFFVLVFVYYSGRDVPALLWPLAALACVLPLVRWEPPAYDRRAVYGSAAVAVLGLALGLIPYAAGARSTAPAPVDLKVFDYNIHQGLDYYSVPSANALADAIQAADADLVGLQEVNRGWNISAGVDYAAWLRWRFPGYYVSYGPMQTQLFGGLIMSKYPIHDSGWQRYPRGQSTNTRGYVWATIASSAGEVVFVSTHLTPYTGFDEDRAAQATVLEEFWAGRPRTIIAGDFNAEPDDTAIRHLLDAGLKDVAAAGGLGQTPTYSSGEPETRIDYVFASPDVRAVGASIPRTLASDHLPVSASVHVGP
jgi:endonuclease/exonuclease/phosphatase family metal-dependent hydrolase